MTAIIDLGMRFFELIQLHRDNVKEIQSKGKSGRAVFIDLKDELHEIHDRVKKEYPVTDSQKSDIEWKKECVQISYLILFFGVNNSSTEYLRKLIKEIINNQEAESKFVQNCLDKLIKEHKSQKEKNQDLYGKHYLDYDGHQSRMGHYLRHLFQTVKYINDQPRELFPFQEKYNYIKTLRAQLSTHEQAVFMYNTISPLGDPWELSNLITDDNERLITKYNLVKNLPEGFTKDINPKDYFPDIFYEFDKNPTANRLELEKHYH